MDLVHMLRSLMMVTDHTYLVVCGSKPVHQVYRFMRWLGTPCNEVFEAEAPQKQRGHMVL